MADTNNCSTNDSDQTTAPSAKNDAQAANNAQTSAEELAKLADTMSSEGSSINSEDYWFLKLNGNC